MYTDFFVTDFAELKRAFAGWKRPLAERVQGELRNPFTGATVIVPMWVADPSDAEVVRPPGGPSLGQDLEACPHIGHKNIDLTMVADLMAIVLGDEQDAWIGRLLNPPPLVSTQGDKNILAQLPDAFVAAARAWSEADCNDVGRKWSEAVTASGNDWPVYSSTQAVLGLAELAAQAEAGEHMYYWA